MLESDDIYASLKLIVTSFDANYNSNQEGDDDSTSNQDVSIFMRHLNTQEGCTRFIELHGIDIYLSYVLIQKQLLLEVPLSEECIAVVDKNKVNVECLYQHARSAIQWILKILYGLTRFDDLIPLLFSAQHSPTLYNILSAIVKSSAAGMENQKGEVQSDEELTSLAIEGLMLMASAEHGKLTLSTVVDQDETLSRLLFLARTRDEKRSVVASHAIACLSKLSVLSLEIQHILVKEGFVDTFLLNEICSCSSPENFGPCSRALRYIASNDSEIATPLKKQILMRVPELIESLVHGEGDVQATILEIIHGITTVHGFDLCISCFATTQVVEQLAKPFALGKVQEAHLCLGIIVALMKVETPPQFPPKLILEHRVLRLCAHMCATMTGTNKEFVVKFTSVIQLVCNPKRISPPHDVVDTSPEPSPVYFLFVELCQMALSADESYRSEAIRCIHILSRKKDYEEILIHVPDLLGALEVSKFTSTDSEVEVLVNNALETLQPKVLAIEQKLGRKLIGLSELPVNLSTTKVMEEIEKAKSTGNIFYKRGNYPAARLYYRHCLSTIRILEANIGRPDELKKKAWINSLSIGSAVQLMKGDGNWVDGILSDVLHSGSGDVEKVDVILDEEEENAVPVHRLRPACDASTQERLLQWKVSCSMNLSRCFWKLKQVENAIESISFLIELSPQNWEAYYFRGVINMETGLLQAAKEDLLQAHRNGPRKGCTQISMAWKRLQVYHKRRKASDKKLTKEMLRYLSTSIPGITDMNLTASEEKLPIQ